MSDLLFGSLRVGVRAAAPALRSEVESAFRQGRLLPAGEPDLLLELEEGPVGPAAGSKDHFLCMGCEVRGRPGPPPAFHLTVPPRQPVRDLVVVLTHRLLLQASACYLHAGAVRYRDRLRLFLGPSGSGKSTVCTLLMRRGGELLSDDQVLLRLTADGPRLSASEGNLRLDRRSQEFLSCQALAGPERLYGKVLKKEIAASAAGVWVPGLEVLPGDLFLCSLGERLECAPVSPSRAVAALLAQFRYAVRWQGPAEAERVLELATSLVTASRCRQLTLSPNLGDLAEWCDTL